MIKILPQYAAYPQRPLRKLPPSTPTTSRLLGGYSSQHGADIPTLLSLKRHRTSDLSDSDPERHCQKQQPRDHSASSSNNQPHHDQPLAQLKGNSAEVTHDRPITTLRPRFPDEHKSTPHFSTSESDAAANKRTESIREWYRVHTNPIASQYPHKTPSISSSSSSHLPSNTPDTKDPAVPHPDDDHLRVQTPTHPPPPPEQRILTSVTSFGGYHSAPPAPPPRPTLTSILKSNREATSSALNHLSATRHNSNHKPKPGRQSPPSSTPSPNSISLTPPLPTHSTSPA